LDKNSKDSYLWATTSIEEVEKFMEFAQDASAVSVDKLQLETRKAVALWANGYIKEAVDVCSISQLESGADRHWPLLLLRAVIHVGAKEYTNALECIRTMMDTNELSKTANAEFTKVYWNRLLLLKGQCHQSLSQVDEAARCYLKLLQHGGDDNEQMSVCRNALVQLLQTWTESENYLLIVDHIKQWKTDRFDNSKESSLYWFRMALSMPNFHPYVLLAIARTNTHEVISALYKNTNERLTKNKSEGDNKILAETLCFYRACILLYCSTSDQEQKSGLKMLMEMILSAQDGDYDRYSPKLIAVTHVTRTLLNRGIVLQRQVETASEEHQQNVEKGRKEVLKQLRHIATFHSDMLKACRRTPYRDPRLALARLELKVGHEVEFRRIIKDLLHKQFDHWPEPEELWAISDRLGKVAVILGATDEDQDTIAAWQLTNLPNFKEPTTSASSTSTLEKISTEDEAEGTKADLLDAQVMAGSQPTNSDAAASMGTSAAANVTVNPDESVPDPTTSTDSETSSDLVFGSEPNFSCDGCGVAWAVMEDFYACKHCAVTQLCAPCHVKLLARQLPPTTCNPHHEFVHVPPFDRPAWAALGPGNMLYGGKVVSQVAWLEQLRTRWALRQDQIDARRDRLRKLLAKMLQVYVTSVAIVKFWRRYKRERYEDEEFQRIALVDGVYTWVT
jgi:tetratricopeptide (TPR) repeat protein